MRTSASHSSASGHTGRSNGQTEVAAHACASMCDEMVVLWRLAVLDPTMSPQRYSSISASRLHGSICILCAKFVHKLSISSILFVKCGRAYDHHELSPSVCLCF